MYRRGGVTQAGTGRRKAARRDDRCVAAPHLRSAMARKLLEYAGRQVQECDGQPGDQTWSATVVSTLSSLSIFSRSVSARVKELQSSLVTDIKYKLAEQFLMSCCKMLTGLLLKQLYCCHNIDLVCLWIHCCVCCRISSLLRCHVPTHDTLFS